MYGYFYQFYAQAKERLGIERRKVTTAGIVEARRDG
jgi:hypothetical protein